MMNKFFFFGLVFLASLTGHSRQYFFTGYSLSDGLSQSVINCVFQDSRGYIWFGTQNGLNRFDGYSFEVYSSEPDDSTSISNRWIYSITEDRDGNLWIGTKGGLNRYIRKENRFERIDYSIPYPYDLADVVYDVKCSRNGNILINTPPILTLCDPQKMTFRHYVSSLAYDSSIKDYNIPLLEGSDGKIWIGSTRGLACYLPDSDSFQIYTHGKHSQGVLSSDNITALCQDNRGTVWVGTDEGINLITENHSDEIGHTPVIRPVNLTGNSFIRAIQNDHSGNIWVGTEGEGLILVNRTHTGEMITESFLAGNSGLNHDIILSLEIDRSENLWIGTLSGVNKTDLKKQKFQLYRTSDSPHSIDLAGNVIASLYKDNNDCIWVGTWGEGLTIYNRGTGKSEHYSSILTGRNHIPNDFVHTLFEDAEHTLWIGTRDGLLVYEENRGNFVRPAQYNGNPGLPGFFGLRIFKMIQGHNGDYWIATQDGLFRIKQPGAELERFHTEAPDNKRISSNLVYAVMEDSEGYIWVGTAEGLDQFRPEAPMIKHFKKIRGEANSLADNFITSLCEDHLGNIWIGTNSYVNKYSKKDSAFSYFAKEEGLPGNLIYSILKDNNNGLWIATGNGLCHFNETGNSFRSYAVEDGLQSPEFNLGASFLSHDGEVFFGGMNGFNSFYPDSLINNPYIPVITFTAAYKMREGEKEFLLWGKDNRIELNYNDYSFTIEYSAMEFTNPSRNLYKYRLEDIDDEWIEAGNRNFIAFSNLAPGEYTLWVTGCNNDGLWNENGTYLNILVRPPWWRSKFAYTGYILLAALLIFILFNRQESHHARNRRILEQKVKQRTLRIESQKAEILEKNRELDELNASKDKFFSIIAHDLRNPFNAIIGMSDVLLMNLQELSQEQLKKYIEHIKGTSQQAHELLENLLLWARSQTGILIFHPEPVDMKQLIEDSMAHVNVQAIRKNITINTQIHRNVVISADANMLKTVMRNLLTNALKFTYRNGEIWIRLSAEDDLCILSVKDNGTGMPEEKTETLFQVGAVHKTRGTDQEPGTGLGLILCRELIEKQNGRIEVESEEGKGSEFRIILPVSTK
jgi:signal transduction histidine kinase/ligand-binding sensor domain-containing protein